MTRGPCHKSQTFSTLPLLNGYPIEPLDVQIRKARPSSELGKVVMNMYHEVTKGNLYLDGEMKLSTLDVPWSNECRVGSRMNLRFSSSKTLRVEGLEILAGGTIGFSGKSSIDEEEEEGEEDSCTDHSRSLEMFRLAEFEETEDMMNVKDKCRLDKCMLEGQWKVKVEHRRYTS